MRITRNIFLARSYLHQWLSKPSVDTPLNNYIKLMNKITPKERQKVKNDPQIKKLLKRVNS